MVAGGRMYTGMRTCPPADGRWRALTCHRQVIHHALFKSFSIVKTKNKVSEWIPYFLVRVVIQNFSKTIVVQFVFEVIG